MLFLENSLLAKLRAKTSEFLYLNLKNGGDGLQF